MAAMRRPPRFRRPRRSEARGQRVPTPTPSRRGAPAAPSPRRRTRRVATRPGARPACGTGRDGARSRFPLRLLASTCCPGRAGSRRGTGPSRSPPRSKNGRRSGRRDRARAVVAASQAVNPMPPAATRGRRQREEERASTVTIAPSRTIATRCERVGRAAAGSARWRRLAHHRTPPRRPSARAGLEPLARRARARRRPAAITQSDDADRRPCTSAVDAHLAQRRGRPRREPGTRG